MHLHPPCPKSGINIMPETSVIT